MSEHQIQCAIVKYLTLVLPKTYICVHIPNGGKRSLVAGKLLKQAGMTAGMPDLIILAPQGRCYFLEVKTPKGRLSKPQEGFRDKCEELSIPWALVRSTDDVRAALATFGIKTKEAAQ